jgi:thioredoxin 1
MGAAHPLTTAEFEEKVKNSPVPVLIDFWAAWCGPCIQIAPHVEAVAEQFSGRANVYKVDVDSEGDLATQFHVMSIPTLLIFKNGNVVDQIIGFTTKDQIAEKLESVLN